MKIESSLSQMLLAQQELVSRSTYPTHNNSDVTGYLRPKDLEETKQLATPQRQAPKDIVEFNSIEIDLDDYMDHEDDFEDAPLLDVRHLSAREMVDVSLDLYIDGALSFEEYSMLAFQPELHPKYDETIGALTGERSAPDRKRDFIGEWEDRFNFERKYPSGDPGQLHRIDRILGVLHTLGQPMDFSA